MNKFDREHAHNIAAYQKRVQDILNEYEKDIARLASAITVDGDRPFSFSDHPALKDRYNRLLRDLAAELHISIENGEKVEWGRADAKNDALAASYTGSIANAALAGYIARNNEALEAFAQRKVKGLDLSGRVWRITDQFSTEIQDAIDIALRDHLTADELSREVRRYLKNPDALFRRVRDEHGNLHLSKRAKAYHPGQGVYRSAYMNARRLAATEINMAYRTSDHMRQEKLDFVVGIEVHLSNNHNCKGVPPGKFYDICDKLQGKYPKDFKFVGWHPHCRCYTTAILKTREEMREDNRRIAKGKQPSKESVNSVKELPDNFKKWLQDNGERIQRAKSLPYFLKDNGSMKDGVWEIDKGLSSNKAQQPDVKASKLGEMIEGAQKYPVEANPVKMLEKVLDTDEIVKKVGGADRTKGSCSSLAFTYAGCRAGYDVEDFRGGNSQSYFAQNGNIRKITEKVGGVVEKQYNDFTAAKNLLDKVKEGREYYFACGKHAAIVRKTKDGYEYLELQSANNNGWHKLTSEVLKWRFGAKKSHTFSRIKMYANNELIDIELLKNDSGYKDLLSYINTASDNQKKGAGGGMK